MSKVGRLLFWMKVVVFLDFFGVALVVPLLTSYFRDAGIDTKLLGVMSSLYSVSQIFGGIVMGILSDTQSKHDVLMLSLLGSAVSYFIVGSSKSVSMLFLSRILVGLVKQTYTIATTVVNEITDNNPELRSQELGRLSAISTVSFIVGPSIGSILYSVVSKGAPAKAAALCFVLNAAICITFIPRTGIMASGSRTVKVNADGDTDKRSSSLTRFLSKPYVVFLSQLYDLASIQNVLPVILMRLSIIFVESSMSSRNIVNYYENRFGIPTAALGFMQTATSVIGMMIQIFLLNPLLKLFGGNTAMIVYALIAMAICSFIEGIAPSYFFFVIFSQVPTVVASSLLTASMRNLFSDTVPSEHMGKSLGVFSMLISGVGVTAPLYASQVFSTISGDRKGYVTCLHFMVLVVVIGHSLKGMRVGKVKVAEKRATIEVPVKNTDSTLKTGGKSAVEKQTSMSLLRKNAAVAAKK